MTYPFHVHLGDYIVSAHLIFELLAYSIGFRYYIWLRDHSPDPIGDENRMWIFISALLGAFVGGHSLGIMEQPTLLEWSFIYFMTHKTIIGSLAAGLLAVKITKRKLKVTASSGDIMAFPLILGFSIGRIGCHFSGLTDDSIGLPTTLPWGIDFGDGLPRHPVHLYEIVFLMALAAGIYGIKQRKALPDGMQFRIFMVSYLSWRFGLEYLKPVWYWPNIGLSSIQIACIACLIYYSCVPLKKQ